jgi:hypothetical protein
MNINDILNPNYTEEIQSLRNTQPARPAAVNGDGRFPYPLPCLTVEVEGTLSPKVQPEITQQIQIPKTVKKQRKCEHLN